MPTPAVHYTAAGITDRGRKRANNQDAFGFSVEHGAYLVCDGMGGAAGGEVASTMAVDEALSLLKSRDHSATVPEIAEQAVSAANQAIFSRSQSNSKLSGMGTTLVGLVAEDSHVWVINVGDSRCYRMRHQRLEQLTRDHSLVEEQVRQGRMTPAEALRSPLRNVITRVLGTQSEVTPDIFEMEAEPGDLFLLTSDGLSHELPDSEIESLLSTDDSLQDQCTRLVEAAKKAGGQDNITCILVRAEA